MYVDFIYYGSSFTGSLISESEFPSIERQAECYIDIITFNRLHNGWAVTDQVKNAVCAVAEVIKKYDQEIKTADSAIAIKSENNDGCSVTYEDTKTARDNIDLLKYNAASLYLMSTGLMDRSIAQ